MHWKLSIKQKPVLFCKYLCNESLDLYNIWNLYSYDSSELPQKFWQRFVHTRACTRCKCVHMRWNARVSVFYLCTRVHAWIIIKILVVDHYYHMTLSLKFLKKQSFGCRDVCKTIFAIKNHQFSMYFAHFHSFSPPKGTKMDNFWMIMEFFADMEQDQIFPQTCFVNNQNFSKKYIFKFLTINKIIVEIIIYRL